MTPLPVTLFPLARAASKPGAFVAVVLIGLAVYLAAKHPTQAQQQTLR